jgi:hypothetical protein
VTTPSIVKLSIFYDLSTGAARTDPVNRSLRQKLEAIHGVNIVSSLRSARLGNRLPADLVVEFNIKDIKQTLNILREQLGYISSRLEIEAYGKKLKVESSNQDELINAVEAIQNFLEELAISHSSINSYLNPKKLLIKAALIGVEVSLLGIIIQSLSSLDGSAVLLYILGLLMLLGILLFMTPQLFKMKGLLVIAVINFLIVVMIPTLRVIRPSSTPVGLEILILIVILGGALFVLVSSFSLLIYRYIAEYIFPVY